MLDLRLESGPRDLVSDVAGIRIGNAEDATVRTGVTVVLPDAPVVAAVDVRGGAPGTRETDALAPDCLVERIHALVLSGGSVFGLAAADAVTAALSSRGVGLPIAPRPVPVVPAAILFDLANGGDKQWTESPYPRLARKALEAAAADFSLPRAGAGFGALAGDRAGGLGSASLVVAEPGMTVGALVAVNSFGAPLDAARNRLCLPKTGILGANTTIAMVATDVALTRVELQRVARMAHDGLARAIRPIHTPFDGDTVFALSTFARRIDETTMPRPLLLTILGSMAADALERAVWKGLGEKVAPLSVHGS